MLKRQMPRFRESPTSGNIKSQNPKPTQVVMVENTKALERTRVKELGKMKKP